MEREAVYEVRGARLAADERGAGPPTIVWSHGLISSRASEDALGLSDWPVVAEAARVVRYDNRGHGASSAPSDPDELRWSELGLDMLAVADAAGAPRFVAGGASMGCASALHAAVVAPERVVGLVLQIPPTAWATRAGQADIYNAGASFLRADPERALDLIVAGFATTPPLGELLSPQYPEAASRLQAHARTLEPLTLATVFEGAARSDLPPPEAVGALAVPTLILAWEGDAGHPLATAARLHGLIAGSELHVARTIDAVRGWPARIAAFCARFP